MRRIWLALCCALTAGLLVGCTSSFLPKAKDISKVELMRTIAIDGAPDEKVKVTVSSGVKQGSSGGKPLILSDEAQTVSSACQLIQKSGNGYVTYGHVTECVVGKEAAKAGVDQLLDYMQRDFEMRMDTLIFLANQDKAGDLITKAATKDIAATDRLQEIGREMPLKSGAWRCTVREFLVDQYNNGLAMMPTLELEKVNGEYTIGVKGMAIFHETKLVEQLDEEASRGACVLINEGGAPNQDVKLKDGGVAGLKITSSSCRWKAQWENDNLVGMTAEVKVRANLAELNGTVEFRKKSVLHEIEQKLAAAITKEAISALKEEKNHGDFLHLERELEMQYPGRLKEIEAHWEEWLKTIHFRVKTEATVERSYDVSRGVEQSGKEG